MPFPAFCALKSVLKFAITVPYFKTKNGRNAQKLHNIFLSTYPNEEISISGKISNDEH
jgi:hypothetical protein